MVLNKNQFSIFNFQFSKRTLIPSLVVVAVVLLSGCSISYKLNGASIDYTKIKSISISDFPNAAELVHPPFSAYFSEKLRDAYTTQTRLQVLRKGGDLHLEGEIVGYQISPGPVGANSMSVATETKLTVTINVRFSNYKNPEDDFEKKFTAYRTFIKPINEVQDDMMKDITTEIVDNVYNETVAKW
jgi:Lipopolysaccharide-assembly